MKIKLSRMSGDMLEKISQVINVAPDLAGKEVSQAKIEKNRELLQREMVRRKSKENEYKHNQ